MEFKLPAPAKNRTALRLPTLKCAGGRCQATGISGISVMENRFIFPRPYACESLPRTEIGRRLRRPLCPAWMAHGRMRVTFVLADA
jgi:hypothetical protein